MDAKPIGAAQRKNVRKFASQLTENMEIGRMPPQAVDIEEAVLGALMLEKDALTAVIDVLQPETFYKDANQAIFRAIQSLFTRSEPVDILTVTAELRKTAELELVGGPYYITSLTNRVGSAANIEFHARIIAQKYILRELIRISSEISREAYDETTDVFDLLDSAESNLFQIAENNIRKGHTSMSALVNEAILQIESIKGKEDGLTGVPTGLTDLDRLTSGWQRQNLIIIAARPAMGKTAFVLSIARNAAVQFGKGVAFFSLEMGAVELVNRLLSAEAEVEGDKLKKGNLNDTEWARIQAKIPLLADAPMFIDDTPALTIFELRAKCRRLKAQHDIQMVVIDYLQLMSGGGDMRGGNREQEIAAISRALKNLAKELDIPVIALSSSAAPLKRGAEPKSLS